VNRSRFVSLVVCALLFLAARGAGAQGAPAFDATLLPTLRRAAGLVPGDKPTSVRVITLGPRRGALASMVEGATSSDSITAGYPALQVRYRHDWIVVDAGMGREFFRQATNFSDAAYDTLQRALRDTRMVLFTHEHHDHVAGALRSEFLAQVREHTLFTREQVRTLMEHPSDARVKLDSAAAAGWLTIDYQGWLPIAPGVVLVKAPGHTPGSQMVYVRLASGREILLSGDVAWHLSGVTGLRQKPPKTSQALGEDTTAIASQLAWLRDVGAAGVAVVVSHDIDSIDDLVRRGVLARGFDLRR
jgi:glyoxylase-like metal-dependent hydrolase (beta-lactamase superfamily II)